MTNLFVKDKNGVERDIVVGFDNAADYRNPIALLSMEHI